MDTPATTSIQEVPENRVLVGLVAGRIVNFVMANLAIRPMIIVNPQDATGKVNGIVFLDGTNDQGNHPGHAFVVPLGEYVRDVAYCPVPCDFDPAAELVAGTWHWPPRQLSIADGLSPETSVGFVGTIKELFDERDTRILNTVDDMLNSHNEMVRGVIGSLQAKEAATKGVSLVPGDPAAGLGKFANAGAGIDLEAKSQTPSLAPGVEQEPACSSAEAGIVCGEPESAHTAEAAKGDVGMDHNFANDATPPAEAPSPTPETAS